MSAPKVTLTDLRQAEPGAFLFCPACRAEFSAHPGDYWNMNPRDPFQCNGEETHRMRNMRLARKITVIEVIK